MKKVLILILAVILSLSVFAMAACQQPCETHVDVNHDGICDVCETEGLTVTHTDSNHDGKCDGCGTATTYEHTDAQHDGKCDVCNKDVEVVHVDANNDGYCDVCNYEYDWVEALAAAKEYVDGLYLNAEEVTAADYTLTTVVAIGGVTYNVAWEITSDVAGQTAVALGSVGEDKQLTVDVDEFSAAEVAYTLVATVSDAAGHSVTVEYARKVNKFVVSSYADYIAHCEAADGETFTIRAYVIGAVSTTSSSKGSLYLQDADGNGYYAYKPSLPSDVTASEEALDAYFPFGTEVCVTGTGTRYGGQYEFNSGCTVVKTGNVAEDGVLTFENVTEAWGNAKNQGDHDVLAGDQNKLVVIENAILTKVDGSYYYFTVNGVQFNIYKTNYFMAEQADIDALFAKFEVGKAATIKGIVSCYSNLYQIYPLDVECISNVHTPELSDAEKVAVAIDALTLTNSAKEGDVIELPTTGTLETTISWALDGTYEIATLEGSTLTITAAPAVTTDIKLVATITSGTASDTKEFTVTVGASFVMNEGHAYVAAVTQVKLEGKVLYLDGGVSGRYLTTTEDPTKAVAVYAEKAEGGYKLYILVEGNKQYITVYSNADGKDSVNYDAAGTTVYTYNAAVNAFVTNFNGTDKYLGTYSTFNTISVSNLSYITAENTGVSQFPLEVLPVADGATLAASVTQVKLEGKVLYLDGGVSGRYLTTTEDAASAVVIYAEKVDGGYKFYKLNGETKEYITVYSNADGKDSVNYDAAGTTVFTYDATVNAWKTTFADKEKYLGTYSTFNTISVSNLSYITAENTGVSQFPLEFKPAVAGSVEEPTAVVINGTSYTEAQAEEALLALKAGDVVEILADVTISKEYTFVAGEYTVGEGVTFLIQANAVAPAGTKLTVGANTTIVVESGAHVDLSALTQDEFATSTSARLEIASDAKVTMPAYTEQLWNDKYLKVVIEAMVADSDVGAQLVLGSTTLTKTANGWEAPAAEAEVYTLEVPAKGSSWTADTLINDIFYVSGKVKTESVKIDGAAYEADGLTFTTSQFSLTSGKVQVNDGVWSNSIFFTVPAGKQATVVVYAAQKSDKTTSLKVMNAAGEGVTVTGLLINGTAADAFDTLPTTSVSKYEFTLSEGTYHIGGAGGGAYVYGMTVTLDVATPAHVCESVCPECNKCLDAACTETACAEKCEGHAITTIAGALAGAEGDTAQFTGTVVGIYEAWSSYNNMSVYVSDGSNKILVFRCKTQVGLGDEVSVNGTITIYNGTAQIAAGDTVTLVTAHVCSAWTDATCTAAAVCTVCGKENGTALGHTEANAEGKCDRCGVDLEAAASQVTVTAQYTGTATTNMSANNNAETIGLDATIFTVSSACYNGTSNRVGLNKAGNMRLYKNGNCDMTISVADGYEIVSIKITLASSSKDAGVLVVTNGTETIAAEDNVYTINGSTVVLSNSGSDQIHIASIEIVYAPVAE